MALNQYFFSLFMMAESLSTAPAFASYRSYETWHGICSAGGLAAFFDDSPWRHGAVAAYSDGELARLIRHGIKKDGRGVRFMSVHESNWQSDADLVAVISYVRSVPPVTREVGSTNIRTLGKVLDRLDMIPIDVARKIDHTKIEFGPPPSPTAEYGRFIGRMCTGCHGDHLSGGPIPGTPPDFPVPLNITFHETGLKGWTYADFEKLAASGVRKNGQKLLDFMPIEAIRNMDDTERRAIFLYLQSVPPLAFGGR